VAVQLDLVLRRIFFKRRLVLFVRAEVLETASRDFVLHISLDLFALREHHRIETFEWDQCFRSWALRGGDADEDD